MPSPDQAGPPGPAEPELSAEDAKLLTLARSSRARVGAGSGAALRDDIGRTYTAASVELPSLRLSAVQAAVAAAVSSGADRIEAVAVVGGPVPLDPDDVALLSHLGVATVHLAGADGVRVPGSQLA